MLCYVNNSQKEWPKIVEDHFKDFHHCLIHEIGASHAFEDVDEVRVVFVFSGVCSSRAYAVRRVKNRKQLRI